MSTTDDFRAGKWDLTATVAVAPEAPASVAEAADRRAVPKPATDSTEPPHAGVSILDALLVAGWMGLAFGLVETGYFAFVKFGLGGMPPSGVRLLWMCPVMQAATFLALAAPLVLAAAVGRKRVAMALLVCFLAFVGATGFAFLIPGVHTAARLLLAGGVAVQVWRYAKTREAKILHAARRTVAWLLVVVIAIMFFLEGTRWIAARRAVAALPAADGLAPNVLLIVLDTVSAEAVNLDGAEPPSGDTAETPHLRAFAEQGTVFTQAVAPAPWTLPSHASMFTGRHASELSCRWFTALDDTYPTIAERLQQEGYLTAGFVANLWLCRADMGLARGFIHYDDFSITPARFLLSTELGRRAAGVPWICTDDKLVGRKTAADVARELLDWLDGSRSGSAGRPFFAFLNFFDAHDPYVPPAGFATAPCRTDAQTRTLCDWWDLDKLSLTRDQIDFARTNYLDCIHYLDDRLGALFGELERRGVLDDTLVIVTSDHGEHFGDHQLFGHGNSLYQPTIHVPLILHWPGRVPAGARFDQAVCLRELPATILELIGAENDRNPRAARTQDARASFPGESLSRFWEDSEDGARRPPACVVSSIAAPVKFPPCQGRSPVFRGPMKSAIVGRFKYIRAGESEELFDLRQDPGELRNLADEERFQAKLKWIRGVLPDTLSAETAR